MPLPDVDPDSFHLQVTAMLDSEGASYEHVDPFLPGEQTLIVTAGERTLEIKGDSRRQLVERLEHALEAE